ncbi:hypothetical protein SS1G_00041 [Sclerotinia sclerotiorum 1980 UF-70]|uniref:Alpha/beta hydrolase fold-3 domain-containing protein n=1 Tax=Sclerotinia sclerotiorum (strain ATCC 18683 / 1980 / Ss-1) TaxID=665079 RepID=A7E419_SCLS1|nr:hypothetical protein SS1G_00041 [Sclerotinia sclerotiorum 1980 UF-70]EDN90641.1 hypothetical protein SS1G_00041 [Sclerotinia sclerotiorum 1980 UF-70]
MVLPPPLPSGPIYPPTLSIWKRITFAIKVRLLKTISNIFIAIMTNPYNRSRATLPTFTKTYPKHPSLTHRIWIPSTYQSGDAPLPLYLNIHGGGFVIGKPALDDGFCTHFSSKHRILVISLDYSKAPGSPYPQAVNELTDIVNAILEDESLPFDRAKVAIGGFSAGGTLSLAVPQAASLQGKIQGVCAFYPPCNFVTPLSVSIAARPEHAPKDLLEEMAPLFNYAYLPPGTDLCDPRLSVAYAKREVLPKKICVVGCEFDMLWYDAEFLVERLVGKERVEGELVWEVDGVRWEKVMGVEHAKGQSKEREANGDRKENV